MPSTNVGNALAAHLPLFPTPFHLSNPNHPLPHPHQLHNSLSAVTASLHNCILFYSLASAFLFRPFSPHPLHIPLIPAAMPDRRRRCAAAAVVTYDYVCRFLGVSAAEYRFLLSEPCASQFSTRSHPTSDAQAVALACALLIAHGASWPLARRYLRVFISLFAPDTLPMLDADSISPFASHISTPHEPIQAPPPLDPNPPWLSLNFSVNRELSPEGAAAVIAACLLLPQPFNIEIDMHSCPKLVSIPLKPWLPLLRTERERTSGERASSRLIGLCLDACPLKRFDISTFSYLADLRWISLRSTLLANLWRTAELLGTFPSLTAALLGGDMCEWDKFDSMKKACRKALESEVAKSNHSSEITTDPQSRHCVDHYVPHTAQLSTSATEEILRRKRSDSITQTDVLPSTHITSSTNTNSASSTAGRALFEVDPQNSSFFIRLRPTPVTTARHYRRFLIAAMQHPLRMLDGKVVTARERGDAAKTLRDKFEHPRALQSHQRGPSLMQLLRSREVGFAVTPRAPRAPQPQPQSGPRKRRRVSRHCPVTNILAAVAAAGIPPVCGPSKLGPSTSLAVALAAASMGSGQKVISEKLRLVREAACPTNPGRESVISSNPRARGKVELSSSEIGSATRPCRKNLIYALDSNREGTFEKNFSSALVSRSGAPRVQYLCQGNDRPRQFEYNPANPAELVYGTEYGYLVVIDEESGQVKGSCSTGGGPGNRATGDLIRKTSSFETLSTNRQTRPDLQGSSKPETVYGLSWLNKRSDMFISGTNGGSIHVYNVNWMGSGKNGGCTTACETFDQLTSINVNSDDVRFAVSGITHDVGIFDLATGRRTETMRDCHAGVINVIKFAHQNPHVLVSASFDRCVKKWDLRESRPGGGRRPIFTTRSKTDNVMACFSPDDSCLLVSAVDNEVRQYSACDGALMQEFNIPKTHSKYNFTRSYYMNDRDYIVSGSCMESVVRVFNARTGAFFAEVDMDNRESSRRRHFCVQSLRADPSRRFALSALLVSHNDSVNEVIASVDLHSR